jgi:N-acetylglutamate synthase-like GNAT family acetyltransferase
MLGDLPLTHHRDDYTLTTDRAAIDLDAALSLLRETHWGGTIDRARLGRAVAHSITFGVLRRGVLVGFGRVVTDLATYGYLTDVVVAPAERGRRLGEWMVVSMLQHPELQGLRRLALLTRDAATLYARLGFAAGSGPLHYMELCPGADAPPGPEPGSS